ncbi:MAG: aminomethyl-transferring glycine dehydrogenase subunit GcvPB, partial [Chloroflexota bacterium]|nr:aminomethyl-transferring glycine dehydrogenase subunit GcvPB [Chloroflexota bacterium]
MAIEPLIFELSKAGRHGTTVPEVDVPQVEIPAALCRDELGLPEVSEIDVIRHYTRMSQKNHAIDINFYPLGSCTMKYNSKINELVARMPGFAHIHPLQDESSVQGALELMYELQGYLAEISGFDAVTLQPAAGAHGELTGCLIARSYHEERGDTVLDTFLVPESADGSKVATAAMVFFNVFSVPS